MRFFKTILIALLSLSFSTSVLAQYETTPSQRLRKLSLRLRGLEPTLTEYEALENITVESTDEYFNQLASVWVSTLYFKGNFAQTLDDIIRIDYNPGTQYQQEIDTIRSYLQNPDEADFPETRNSLETSEGIPISYSDISKTQINDGFKWIDFLTSNDFAINSKAYSIINDVAGDSGIIESEYLSLIRRQPELSNDFNKALRVITGIELEEGELSNENATLAYQELHKIVLGSETEDSPSPENIINLISVIFDRLKNEKDNTDFLNQIKSQPLDKLINKYALIVDLESFRRRANITQLMLDQLTYLEEEGYFSSDAQNFVSRSVYIISRDSFYRTSTTAAEQINNLVKELLFNEDSIDVYWNSSKVYAEDTLKFIQYLVENYKAARPYQGSYSTLYLAKYFPDIAVSILNAAKELRSNRNLLSTRQGRQNDQILGSSEFFQTSFNNLKLILLNGSFDFARFESENTLRNFLGSTSFPIQSSSVTNILSSRSIRQRFSQTQYSRAALFHRLYFCDEMIPNVSSGNDLSEQTFDGLILNTAEQNSTDTIPTQVDEHQKDGCRFCHQKIDSVQEVIDGERNSEASTEIRYQSFNGEIKSYIINNPNELISKAIETESFKLCQAKRFWNIYIGKDVPIKQDKLSALGDEFMEHNFDLEKIAVRLTNAEEFYSHEWSLKPKNFNDVKPLFNRCNSCHADKGDIYLPKLNVFPFTYEGENAEQIKDDTIGTLQRILYKTQSLHSGENAEMPPPIAGWKPSIEELNTVNQWIKDGLRDESGNALLSETESQELLDDINNEMAEKLDQRTPSPSFDTTWARYLSANQWINIFTQRFPFSSSNCVSEINEQNKLAWGQNNFETGRPDAISPSYTIDTALKNCLPGALQVEISLTEQADSGLVADRRVNYGLQVLNEYFTSQGLNSKLSSNTWVNLPEETKSAWINALLEASLPHLKNTTDHADFKSEIVGVINEYHSINEEQSLDTTLSLVMQMVIRSKYFIIY